ncbi:helix-turn-helix domain-containing protein [Haloterrigena gelatinilytica]|uniref:helix-turn-helix domain-containing protein n=1 Tax=Haloterrigena gelatinilytica TaxID=2741724 RepID=UPI003742E0F8
MSTSKQQFAVPDDLESPQAKLVYLALRQTDEATASELQHRLNLSKLTLFPLLASLVANDYVQRTGNGYSCQ